MEFGYIRNSEGQLELNASQTNSIYGASDTVQPPALTLLPCIKAFDALANPGLIDVTQLAQEVSGKLDKVINDKPVRYITDAYDDGKNWWRQWSDGWLEQGGIVTSNTSGIATLVVPFASANYTVVVNQRPYANLDTRAITSSAANDTTTFKLDTLTISATSSRQVLECNFYACGQGA